MYTWARSGGYECSTKGDARFSAFNAIMPDSRTIEQWYQCDVKGYQPGGRDWRMGKGKPSLIEYPEGHQWLMYLSLWRFWVLDNIPLFNELKVQADAHAKLLSDHFASTPINQAHALAVILNEWS